MLLPHDLALHIHAQKCSLTLWMLDLACDLLGSMEYYGLDVSRGHNVLPKCGLILTNIIHYGKNVYFTVSALKRMRIHMEQTGTQLSAWRQPMA